MRAAGGGGWRAAAAEALGAPRLSGAAAPLRDRGSAVSEGHISEAPHRAVEGLDGGAGLRHHGGALPGALQEVSW